MQEIQQVTERRNEGTRSSETLWSFVDPNEKRFNREFIPDHRRGDLLARLLAERAVKDKASIQIYKG